MEVGKRQELVRKALICSKCLRDTHTTDKCTATKRKCKYCQDIFGHHYLLCDSTEQKVRLNHTEAHTEALYDEMDSQLAE